MFVKPRLFRAFNVVFLLLSLSLFAFADTIRLKDGSIIKGRIISFDNGKFTVLIDDGVRQRQLDFSADEIASIVFDSNPAMPQAPLSNNTDPNTKIITVGQNRPKDTSPTVKDTPKVINNPGSGPKPADKTTSGMLPITISIRVLADETANGWTNSGWVVKKGQKIMVRATGRVSLGMGRMTNAGGITTLPDASKLMNDKPTGSLIGVIGGDNNDFIFIGESAEFIAERDGDLFFGVNEGNLSDNSGAFDVVIEIDPNVRK